MCVDFENNNPFAIYAKKLSHKFHTINMTRPEKLGTGIPPQFDIHPYTLAANIVKYNEFKIIEISILSLISTLEKCNSKCNSLIKFSGKSGITRDSRNNSYIGLIFY